VVTGEEKTVFHFHRIVLALRSQYFLSYLQKYDNQDQIPKEIYCKQLETKHFVTLKDFFYTGVCKISAVNAIPLLR
jgi:hypothetical protein